MGISWDTNSWLMVIIISITSIVIAIVFALDVPRPKTSMDWPVTEGIRHTVGSYTCFQTKHPVGSALAVYYNPRDPKYGARVRGFTT